MVLFYIAPFTGCLLLVGVIYRIFKPHKEVKISLQAMLIAAGVVLVAIPGFSNISAKAGPLEIALATEVAGQLKAYSQIAGEYAALIETSHVQSRATKQLAKKMWAEGRNMQITSGIIENAVTDNDILGAAAGVRRGTQSIEELQELLDLAKSQNVK